MEKEYLDVPNKFSFVYQSSFFLLFKNIQWDGTRVQKKDIRHSQDRKGITRTDKGREVEKEYLQVPNYFTFVYHISFLRFYFFNFFWLGEGYWKREEKESV